MKSKNLFLLSLKVVSRRRTLYVLSLHTPHGAGMGICLDLAGSYLGCATITGCLRLWDLSRREAKPHSYPKFLADHIPDFGEVRWILQGLGYLLLKYLCQIK